MTVKRRKKAKRDGVLLVDGDLVCYSMVTSSDFLIETSNEMGEVWETLRAADALEELEARIKEALAFSKCATAFFAFGSVENFRKMLVDATYKSNRRGKRKPLGYYSFCDMTRERWSTLEVPTLEADDVLGLYHTDKRLAPGRTVVFSWDKDMRTLPGLLLHPEGEGLALTEISEAEALAAWLRQTLTGDTADGYSGCPKIGKVKAERLVDVDVIAALVDERGPDEGARIAFKAMVVPAFEEAGLDERAALTQARLARILRAGDCDPTAEHVEVRLWDCNAGRDDRSSRGRSKKRSKRTP